MFPGSNVIDHWFGFDIGLNARLPRGIIFQGGLSTGHQTTDFCDVEDPAKAGNKALVEMLAVGVPAVNNSLNTCHMEQNWLPQVKFLGSYTVPKVEVQIGASFQSIPGIEYAATYAAPNTASSPSRSAACRPSGVATGTTALGLVQPGSFYGDAVQPARRSLREDSPVRPHALQPEPGYLQPVQLGRDQRRQRDLRDVARADRRRGAAPAEGVADVRLLDLGNWVIE